MPAGHLMSFAGTCTCTHAHTYTHTLHKDDSRYEPYPSFRKILLVQQHHVREPNGFGSNAERIDAIVF